MFGTTQFQISLRWTKAVQLEHSFHADHIILNFFVLDSTMLFLHCLQHLSLLFVVVSVNVLPDSLEHVDFELITVLGVVIVDVVV